jgi:plasmid maintenance system antidote protein VapI
VTPGPAPSPGDVLREIIIGRERAPDKILSRIARFARLIPCSPDMIEAILYLNHYITPTMAQRLEKHAGLTAKEWLAIDAKFREENKGELNPPPPTFGRV